MNAKGQLKQWMEAEDFKYDIYADAIKVEPVPMTKNVLQDHTYHIIAEEDYFHDAAAIKVEEVLIDQLLPFVKKESVVEDETADSQDAAAIKVEEVPINELLTFVKKETVVKDETDDLKNQGDEIEIKEEFPGVLNNLVENRAFKEEKAESTSCDRVSTKVFHRVNNLFSSVPNSRQFGPGKSELPNTRLLANNEESLVWDATSKSLQNNRVFTQDLMVWKIEKLFECDTCSKVFCTNDALNKHLLIHIDEKKYVYYLCSTAFLHRDLREQFVTIHSNEKPFVCEVCLKAFQFKWLLKQHLILHMNEKPFVCDICTETFRTSTTLIHHLVEHLNAMPKMCFTPSSSKPVLADTSALVYSEKSHPCAYSKAEILEHHENFKDNKPPDQCSINSKVLPSTSAHQFHTKILENGKPVGCDICVTAYRTTAARKQHVDLHSNEKPFACNICSKAFSCRKLLKTHLTVQTSKFHSTTAFRTKRTLRHASVEEHVLFKQNNLPYVCNICSKVLKYH